LTNGKDACLGIDVVAACEKQKMDELWPHRPAPG
jgi:hypothetical protein